MFGQNTRIWDVGNMAGRPWSPRYTCLSMGLEGDLEPHIGHICYLDGGVYIAIQVPPQHY